jgi:hypothetical protein
MSLHTNEPRCQSSPMSSTSRRYLTGEFVESLPEEIRCCPKHSTSSVSVKERTTSTQTFLYIQLSQQISIYRGIYAHATPVDRFSGFFCHRHGRGDLALPPLPDRPHHKPHPRIRLAHSRAGSGVCGQRRGSLGSPPNPHRAGVEVGCRGLDPRHCRPIHTDVTRHAVVCRSPLLQAQVRCD